MAVLLYLADGDDWNGRASTVLDESGDDETRPIDSCCRTWVWPTHFSPDPRRSGEARTWMDRRLHCIR